MIDKIYDLLEDMEEEIEDAEEYAMRAIECAKTHPAHKAMYLSMAEDELKHFEKLGEILMSHTDMGDELKYFVHKKHSAMLKDHAHVKLMMAKAHE